MATPDCCARGERGERGWHDKVMWSNLAYVAAGAHAACLGVVDVAVLMTAVAFASSLYHRCGERSFLLVDAAFAGLVFLAAVLCLIDAARRDMAHWMVAGSAVLCPTAMYLFVASDLPGSARYDLLHTLWHAVTALGTVGVTVYLCTETETKSVFELVCWEAFCCGLAVAFSCLLAMRDVLERTFVQHLRQVMAQLASATGRREVAVRGCHVPRVWLWAGFFLQTAGTLAIFSTAGTQDLAALLAGASVCSLLYHVLDPECELALDVVLCGVSLLGAAGAVLQQAGHAAASESVVLLGALVLPVVFSWAAFKLQATKRRDDGDACRTHSKSSIESRPHHRTSHWFGTLCTVTAAAAVCATVQGVQEQRE